MQLENLIRAGAFDTLEPNRARLFAAAETILRRAQATAEEKESGQIALFGARVRRCREAAAPAGHAGLGADGAAQLRGRGDRLPPHRASARRLCQGAAASRHDAVRAGRSRRAGRRHARAPGRHGGRAEGARDPHRQPDGLGAHHRCVGLLRGHAVRRGAGALARPAGQWIERAGHRRSAAGRRGAARHRAGRRRRSIRRPPTPVRRCASGCARPQSVPHIRDLLGREGRGKGRVILVPRLGTDAERGDRAARRLQRHAAAGAGAEGDARRRAGGGVVGPRRVRPSPVCR